MAVAGAEPTTEPLVFPAVLTVGMDSDDVNQMDGHDLGEDTLQVTVNDDPAGPEPGLMPSTGVSDCADAGATGATASTAAATANPVKRPNPRTRAAPLSTSRSHRTPRRATGPL